jgi:NMD protein affecting ribosome stability and mRNA decay
MTDDKELWKCPVCGSDDDSNGEWFCEECFKKKGYKQ